MTTIHLDYHRFEEREDKIVVTLMNIFEFMIEREELEKIGRFSIDKGDIVFDTPERKAVARLYFLLEQKYKDMTNKLTNCKARYIEQEIPLIGTQAFGIVDKGTDMIEIKPMTGCNLSCSFCSVGEGPGTKKVWDYVIEPDYLAEELSKLLNYKEETVNIYINPHGEPLLYEPLPELISKIRNNEWVNNIHLITNGILFTKEKLDELKKAGLTHINLSLSELEPEKAKKLMGDNYNLKHILDMIDYIKDKFVLTVAPVYIPTVNDEAIEDIIKLCKKIKCNIGIQNFLMNKKGRKPVKKELPMKDFFRKLKELEQKHDIKLSYDNIEIKKTKELEKPFQRNETLKLNAELYGRIKGEMYAIERDRLITIIGQYNKGRTKAKITKTNHNLFFAVAC